MDENEIKYDNKVVEEGAAKCRRHAKMFNINPKEQTLECNELPCSKECPFTSQQKTGE